MSGNVKRFSVSLPPSLVNEFDEVWQSMNYENRSKAVHDAFRGFITEAQWRKNASGAMIGVVLILSYLDKPGLVEELAVIRNGFKEIIQSNHQMYVDDNKLLDTLNVKGDVGEIKDMIEAIKSKKGVKQVSSSLIAL